MVAFKIQGGGEVRFLKLLLLQKAQVCVCFCPKSNGDHVHFIFNGQNYFIVAVFQEIKISFFHCIHIFFMKCCPIMRLGLDLRFGSFKHFLHNPH